MEKNVKNEMDNEIKIAIVNSTIGMTFVLLMDILFEILIFGVIYAPSTVGLSILLSLVFFTLFTAITKKSYISTIILSVLAIVLNIVNLLKVSYTSEPIYLSDIKFLGKITDLGGLIDFSAIVGNLPIIIIAIIVFSLIIWISKKNSFEIKNLKARLVIIAIDIAILLVLFIPNSVTKEFYLRAFFDTDEYLDFNSYVTSIGYYSRYGFIGGIYGTHLNNVFVEPKDYDEEKLDELLSSSSNNNNEKIGKPNIVIVLSEAFWDITQENNVKFNTDVVNNFHDLKEEGKLVNLISPTYGGMSENVAFEVLTGASMNYFPMGYIPIMTFYGLNRSLEAPSIVKTLKNNGYYTEIAFGKDYYFSEKAYKKMGFDNYIEFDDPQEEKEVTDDFLMQYVIDRLKNKKEDNVLYVVETIEAHMPFREDRYEKYDISIVESDLTEEDNNVLKNYTESIHNADKSLKKIYDFIKDYDEPTILIFLGDHLPYLYSTNNENVMMKFDIFKTDDELSKLYRLYNTQALILSNFDMENFEMDDYLGTDLLLTSIVNQMDIELDDYYKWLYTTRDVLSASNRYISLDKKGDKYRTQELTNEMKDMYKLKEKMQYKLFMSK